MIITTVDIAAVARAVTDILKDSQALQDIGVKHVKRAAPVNQDPSRCPWLGIYPLRTPFNPRALGMGSGYRAQDNEFIVVCQVSHPNDPEACQDRLGLVVQAVTGALLTDPSLKGTVLTLGDFEVSFDSYEKVDDTILQSATVRGVGLTTVSGG
jgi:hypothetical protein